MFVIFMVFDGGCVMLFVLYISSVCFVLSLVSVDSVLGWLKIS